jgi:hypothetical protein
MAAFDFNVFNSVLGAGGNPLGAVGTAFGVPSCLLNLGLQALRLIPTPILILILKSLRSGMRAANSVLESIFGGLRDFLHHIGILTDDGEFVLFSKSGGLGTVGDIIGALAALTGFLAALGGVAGDLYANYQNVSQYIEQVRDCLSGYKNFRRLQENGLDETLPMDPQAFQDYVESSLGPSLYEAEAAIDFINRATVVVDDINSIVSERRANPSLEPLFTEDACQFLAGTIIANSCVLTQPQLSATAEIFRLNFGPPKSTKGQFILSNDGLYFDSQTSGITPALTYLRSEKNKLNKGDLWKMTHNPNLGGRGQAFSINDLKSYVNTILDPNVISETQSLRNYYDADGFLQELIGNRNKRLYDLSAQVSELESGGASQVIVRNLKQSIVSENARLLAQINKRKKQIQLAVELPKIYNTRVEYQVGQVPINDFSYLAGANINFDIERQKAMVFSQVDISGVVSPLPVQSVFVQTKVTTDTSRLEHLIIPEIGDGAIIFDGSGASAIDGVILQTENFLTTDSLIAMYNFLDTDVEAPSSTSFLSRNSASQSNQLYGQLVAKSAGDVFKGGLGIAYFDGITKNSNATPSSVSALGAYFRLPNAPPLDDLLQNNQGATIDFWTHIPDIFTSSGVGNVSSLYRLVLANENVGFNGAASSTDSEYVANSLGTDAVRGFILGFTRDRRLVSGLPASNSQSLNPVSSTSFFLAPTQSISASAATLINRSFFDGLDCKASTTYHSMVKSLNQGMVDCSSDFCHFSITLNPQSDKLTLYFDGQEIATSSLSYVFGIPEGTMPNLPNLAAANSFEYDLTSPTELNSGPKLNNPGTNFKVTPWIVGGGYTDGFQKGNFMGGQYGGLISGLRGYLGSVKFYSKPLTQQEVLNNYNTHKNFFKNIDTSKLS